MTRDAVTILLADLQDIRDASGWKGGELKADRIARLYNYYESWASKAEIYLLTVSEQRTKVKK